MEPTIEPQAQSHKGFYSVVAGFVVVCLVAGLAAWSLIGKNGLSSLDTSGQMDGRQLDATDLQVKMAYENITTKLTYEEQDSVLGESLEELRQVAMDEAAGPVQRVRALNGINYAYTASNFNADEIYNVIFSQPPFSAYYTDSIASSPDPLRPESGSRVEAVERALVKLNELSYDLQPNHYAIVKMEMAKIASYIRDKARNPSSIQNLTKTFAAELEALVKQYDALGPLPTDRVYAISMRTQIMYQHATALQYLGDALDNDAYLKAGDDLFNEAIRFGGSYPSASPDAGRAVLQTLFARIFYASNYWKHYKDTDAERIRQVLRPVLDPGAYADLPIYTVWFPRHKDTTVAPATTFREIAETMPEFKAFLQGRGWTF